MKKRNLGSLALGLILISGIAHAGGTNPFKRSLAARQGGGVHGGGGDVVTEKRIKEIRDNLLDFINRGGDKDLDFKGQFSLDAYENGDVTKDLYGMKLVLSEGAVTVNAIDPEDENLADELKNTRVNGARKICKGILEAKLDGLPYIICDAKAFANMDADPVKNADLQTVQIAHEYHALAGFEQNHGSDSVYWLSDQLRAHMGFEQVRRLVVGKKPGVLDSYLVGEVRKMFSAASTASFRTQSNLKWGNGDCDGVYLAAQGMESTGTGGTRVTGTIEWDTFPRSVTAGFAVKKIQNDLYRVLESPNLPYTGPGRYLPGQIELTTKNDFTVVYADGYRFEAKLVDAKTLVMEASMPLDGGVGLGRQFASYAGPSRGGPNFVPYAYFLCRQR